MWWVAVDGIHFPGVSLPAGTFSARGYRGHYLLVIPEWDLVVVHRVNTFQDNTRVLKSDFGKLLKLILAARPTKKVEDPIIDSRSTTAFDLLLHGGQVVQDAQDRLRMVGKNSKRRVKNLSVVADLVAGDLV